MGQEVVRQENEDEPGKRTRLMGYRDVIRVLGDCSGTDSVRSIKLLHSEKERVNVQLEAFKKMSGLRFIQLFSSKLEWSSSSNDDMSACFSFKHLKYMEWYQFPCKSLDNFDMGNVVVIKLQYSKLEKLWEGVKSCKKLKHLDVSDSSSLTKTGNFIGLKNLEELYLRECSNLEELDSSIGCLQKLVLLDLFNCSRLKRLPNSLCQLHQLTILQLSRCTNLKSIPDLPPSIRELSADDCINLVNLPSNCSELQFLTELWLNDCCKLGSEGFTQVTRLRNLQELRMINCNVSQVSSGIGNLVSLVFLDLSGNTFSSLPESFSNLSQLKYLYINDCSELQLLPPLPSQLTDIDAKNCGSLDVMPFDSMQNAYTFRSKVFKESRLMSNEGLHILLSGKEVPEWCTYRNSESRLMSNEGLLIDLSGKELPEWCTYRDSGNVLSFVAPIQFDHSKICGLILCATRVNDEEAWVYPVIYNKTKGTSHHVGEGIYDRASMMVVFCPLNDTTLVVEAGGTLELDDEGSFDSLALRLVYEGDVVDSGLVLKDARKTTLSLFPLSSEIMTGSNDEDVCSFPIQDEEYTYYDFFPMVS